MNTELINHYQRLIDLTKLDISRLEKEIKSKPLCKCLDQKGLISSYESLIKTLEDKRDILK